VTGLLLVRHGQATHNLEGRWVGRGATPLTEEGQRQAEALAQRLASWSPAITRLYTSPLLRALQTSKEIARRLGLTPVADDGLVEIDFGEVSGLTVGTFRETMPEVFCLWQARGDLSFQFPGGEQRHAFFQRVGLALDRIVARHPGELVAVVAHSGTFRAGLAHLFPETMGDWWVYALHTASITHVHVGDEGNLLVSLNDCQHLDHKRAAGDAAREPRALD
jgi:broad specificity phosphatase PhoE